MSRKELLELIEQLEQNGRFALAASYRARLDARVWERSANGWYSIERPAK